MKKKISYLFVLLLTFLLSCQTTFALAPEDIHSNEALLVNLNTDEVIFHKDTNSNRVPIASLTKLMTYAVVLDEIPDLENTKITVPEGLEAYMASRLASTAQLKDGYEYSALDLLYGMMLPSGCDAAETLARYVGNGDPDVFVAKMNQKAQDLGMYNTVYIDSYGIGNEYENESTEEDQYILVKYLLNKAYFKQIISTEYYIIHGQNGELVSDVNVRNTNYLMGEYSGGEYYNPYSIGGKTGSLYVAGKCLITFAQKGDLNVVAITLGVPGQSNSSYDYHLTDHNTLFDYAFGLTQNITIDLGPEYRSVEIGKMHKIEATTSEPTTITWTSSDPSVASIDQNGIVTGVSQGQAKITATTSTGNIAYTYVSVNFYNGVHVKKSNGPKNPESASGYDPIDMSILKNKGFDYVIIKATNGYNWAEDVDKSFVGNFQSAVDNNMNIGIWVESYAENESEAIDEANHLLNTLNQVQKDKIKLPIFYNVLNTGIKDPILLENIIKTFSTIIKNAGYEVVVENMAYSKDTSKNNATALENINLESLTNDGINLSPMYRPLPPDFKTTMTINNTDVAIWNYKVNAYIGSEGLGTNPILSLMYMNYMKLNTIHKEYIPETIIIVDDDEIIEINNTTTSISTKCYKNNNKVEESNNNYLPQLEKQKLKDILTYDNNHKDKNVKEKGHLPIQFILIVLLVSGIAILIIKYLLDNREEEQ